MLLPSAFPCDPFAVHQTQKPQRPLLPSFASYDVPVLSPRSGPVGLFASCRALQSILGGPVQALQSPLPEPAKVRSSRQTNPFQQRQRLQSPALIVTPPRGKNKRGHDVFEEDMTTHIKDAQSSPEERNVYQTPKRQRRIPTDLPRGLNASDFDALQTPNNLPQQPRRRKPNTQPLDLPPEMSESHKASHASPPPPAQARIQPKSPNKNLVNNEQTSSVQWSPEDDRRLIEAVLSKLNLSSRDWNDCAKQLGKDKDTLGQRWKTLIGEGNVGLRRGSGRMERPGLDIESW